MQAASNKKNMFLRLLKTRIQNDVADPEMQHQMKRCSTSVAGAEAAEVEDVLKQMIQKRKRNVKDNFYRSKQVKLKYWNFRLEKSNYFNNFML